MPTTSITSQARAAARPAASRPRAAPRRTTPRLAAPGCRRPRTQAAGLGAVFQAAGRLVAAGRQPAVAQDVAVQAEHVRRPARWCRSSTFCVTMSRGPALREFGQRQVAGVGPGRAHAHAARRIPVPHQSRVGAKALLARQLLGSNSPRGRSAHRERWGCRSRRSYLRRSALPAARARTSDALHARAPARSCTAPRPTGTSANPPRGWRAAWEGRCRPPSGAALAQRLVQADAPGHRDVQAFHRPAHREPTSRSQVLRVSWRMPVPSAPSTRPPGHASRGRRWSARHRRRCR